MQIAKPCSLNRISPFCCSSNPVGPLTLVLLARLAPGLSAATALQRLLPAYGQLLSQLQALGCPELQLHEPCLATDAGQQSIDLLQAAYSHLPNARPAIDLVIPYGDVTMAVLQAAAGLPLAALSLDFVGVPGAEAPNCTFELVSSLAKAGGWPSGLRLGAGVVDGRSVWRDDTGEPALLACLYAALTVPWT